LVTVNTGFARGGGSGSGSNANGCYLFLSDSDGILTAKDTGECVQITQPVPAPHTGPRMVILTLDGKRMALWSSDGGLTETEGMPPNMADPAGLFIGCRSHRRRLKKTLGGALISDVLFWPNYTLLLPRVTDDTNLRRAVEQYFFWNF
jgi:hypothetical protein